MNRTYLRENKLTRDKCAIVERERQNTDILSYLQYNIYDCKSTSSEVKEIPQFQEGFGNVPSCVIDNENKIRIVPHTHDRCKMQLFMRTYHANPDVAGRGGCSDQESELWQGISSAEKKSCDVLSEVNIDRFEPIIPCLKQEIQNPENIIQSWVRPGIPTRDDAYQRKFLNEYYVKTRGGWVKK